MLYRPLPDGYEEFDYPKDLAYTITLPDPISHNFEAQISSVQYTKYGECEIPEREGERLKLIFNSDGEISDILQ